MDQRKEKKDYYGCGSPVWLVWMATSFGALQPMHLLEKNSNSGCWWAVHVNNKNLCFESKLGFARSLHLHQWLRYLTHSAPDLFSLLYYGNWTKKLGIFPATLTTYKSTLQKIILEMGAGRAVAWSQIGMYATDSSYILLHSLLLTPA